MKIGVTLQKKILPLSILLNKAEYCVNQFFIVQQNKFNFYLFIFLIFVLFLLGGSNYIV